MENDEATTIQDVKTAVADFTAERDWGQFHDPKSLVMALASEVGELADLFRWIKGDESRAFALEPRNSEAIAAELADVFMFAVEISSVCGIDIAEAVERKLKLNAERYPVAKAKGSSLKYDQL